MGVTRLRAAGQGLSAAPRQGPPHVGTREGEPPHRRGREEGEVSVGVLHDPRKGGLGAGEVKGSGVPPACGCRAWNAREARSPRGVLAQPGDIEGFDDPCQGEQGLSGLWGRSLGIPMGAVRVFL